MTMKPGGDPADTFVSLVESWRGERRLHSALVDEQGSFTFAELDDRSKALAGELLARGVGKGSRVGVLFPNGIDAATAYLAVFRIGAIAVPVQTLATPAELREILRHGDVGTLLTVDRFIRHDYVKDLVEIAPSLDGSLPRPLTGLLLPELPFLRDVLVWTADGREGTAVAPPEVLAAAQREVSAADLALIMYTSGSSGEPKGVVHTQGSLTRHARAVAGAYRYREDDRIYGSMPFFWIGGLVACLLASLSAGSTLLVQSRFDPGAALECLRREKATYFIAWPSAVAAVARQPDFAEDDFADMRGGNLLEILGRGLRDVEPGLRPMALGMTETAGPHAMGDRTVPLPESLRGSFGPPVPGIEHRIVEPGTDRELPNGQEGEICVRGPDLMAGFYKRERKDTFDSRGWYRTGDRGYLRDGHVFFVGRLDDLIKSKGANVSPVEVETALRAHPGVALAYVTGLEHPAYGREVAAAVVLKDGAVATAGDIRSSLRSKLAAFKVPSVLVVLQDGELPLMKTGKIDRGAATALLERVRDHNNSL